ncbi:MAG: hypothetical protein R3A13_12225 [Bdellovibrionota bacterium]
MTGNGIGEPKRDGISRLDSEKLIMTSPIESLIFNEHVHIYDCFPGGNPTYIVVGAEVPENLRGEANSLIMEKFKTSEFEQGGFLIESQTGKAAIRLQMSGGEFCGNATRSAAALLIKDFIGGRMLANQANYDLIEKEGNLYRFPVEVSGTEDILYAEVDVSSQEFDVQVEMPVKLAFEAITEHTLKFNEQSIKVKLVDMGGIKHIIVNVEELPFRDDKQFYGSVLDAFRHQLSLNDSPAVGVIWTNLREDETAYIDPLVWVKGTNQYFYESACGSGTIAVSLCELLDKKDRTLTMDIEQPSGYVIFTEVKKDSGGFIGGSIKGKVSIRAELNS